MKTKATRKPIYFTVALFLILPCILASSVDVLAADRNKQRSYGEAVMSVEEILCDINERLGSDLEAVPPTRKGELSASEIILSGQELIDAIEYYENFAKEILENNTLVDKLWYEKTGIPAEEAEWLPCEWEDESAENVPFPTRGTAAYSSMRSAWSPNGWIDCTARGLVNTTSPKTFNKINSVTANSIRVNGLTIEKYKATSYSIKLIDAARTAATNITGTLTKTPPFPLPSSTGTLKVYTEFYAGSP